MKKSVLAVILVTLLFVSGCSIQEFLGTQEKGSGGVSDINSKVDKREWQEAYYETLKSDYPQDSQNIGLDATHVWLYDVNFDDVPEMLLSYLGTSNTVIFLGYSYQDGEVKKILFEDGSIPSELSLWQHKETEEKMWIAEGSFKEGPITYKNISKVVDFSDLSKVKHTTFFEYDEHINISGDLLLSTNLPSLYDIYLNGTKITDLSFENIEEEKTKAYSRHDALEIQRVSAFTAEITTDGEGKMREDTINRTALMKFFNDWSM